MPAGDVLGDRFVVEDEVARGGSRVLHRGWDLDTEMPVAIKLVPDLDPDELHRFEREATLLATTELPGVVRYVAHGATGDGAHFLVTEWLDGETLGQRLERTGLTIEDTLNMARATCQPLAALHARGLVHRDLKPANLMFTGERTDRIKLIDFGLARLTQDVALRVTATGTVLGTIGYMAPEQVRGDRELDPAADVFALGCVLYRCLTGHPPFAGDNQIAVLYKILVAEPPALRQLCPACPPALAAVIAGMLAKVSRDRPAHGAAVASLLADIDDVPVTERLGRGPSEAPTERMSYTLSGETTQLAGGDVAVLLVRSSDARQLAMVATGLPAGARCDPAGDRMLLFTLAEGPTAERLLRLARFARTVSELAPEAQLAIGTDPDRAANALDHIVRAAMFLGDLGGRIAVDPEAVARLASSFQLEQRDGVWVLVGGDSL